MLIQYEVIHFIQANVLLKPYVHHHDLKKKKVRSVS